MNTEQLLKELSQQTCPREVDVVDAVMAQVRQRPYLMPRRNTTLVRRIALSVAAVAAVAIIAVPALMPRSVNDAQLDDMFAYVQDYDYFYHVESAANPIEYLYEDIEDSNE
jgi:hypothetical protein